MRPTAYAYSRFSNASQAEGDSLRRQLKASFDFAEKFDLELDTTLRDHGVSAYTGLNRIKGALGSFINRVESGEIARGSYLLVDSLDRFSRESETQVLNMLTSLTLAGIKVVNVSEEHVLDETATVVDYIRVLIHAARSNQESAEKSRKVRIARAEERKRAREDLKPSTPMGPHWLRLVGETWEIIPQRVEVIRRVFDLKEAGLGNAHIARTFNREGVPTPRLPRSRSTTGPQLSGRWFNSTVGDIASSRAVLGEYQPFTGHPLGKTRTPDGDPIVGFYPRVIEDDQFYRVQAITGGRQHPNARPATKSFPNLLVGLVACGECGGVVGHLRSTFPKRPDWKAAGVLRCNQVYRGLCGNRARIPYAALEADLLPFIANLPIRRRSAIGANDAVLHALEGERDALRAKINILLDQLEGGGLVAERLRQRELELGRVDARITAAKAKVAQSRAVMPVGEAVDELGRLEAEMATANGDDLYAIRARINATLKRIVGRFVMEGDKIVVRLSPEQAVSKIGMLATATAGGRLRWEITNVTPEMEEAAMRHRTVSRANSKL